MRFSVIIPAYNCEDSIGTCLESVLGQGHDDIEIVVMDDGSTDRTGAVCDEAAAKDGRIRVFHGVNRGPLYCRTKGAELASGDYCVYADSDDRLLDGALRVLNEKAEKYSPDMIIYSYVKNSSGVSLPPSGTLTESDRLLTGEELKELYACFFTGTLLNNMWTKAVRRLVLTAGETDYSRYYPMRSAEDRLQAMRACAVAKSVLLIPDRLYSYTVDNQSLTRSRDPRTIPALSAAPIYEEELDLIRSQGLGEEYVSRLNAQHLGAAWYTLSSFWKSCSGKDRRKVLSQDWMSFVPDGCFEGLSENPFVSDKMKELWAAISAGKTHKLDLYLRARSLRKR